MLPKKEIMLPKSKFMLLKKEISLPKMKPVYQNWNRFDKILKF